MRYYSFIVPVYNRPDHIRLLLECLLRQTYKHFEIIVVESGSKIKSDGVVETFKSQLTIHYIYKSNDGQGFSRNRGMQESKGDYLVILDSDVLMDDDYLENLDHSLNENYLDAFGGPDKLHPKSTAIQTAVNFCMTSFLTTGGTRGKKSGIGKYYPRSFNMGVSREVYDTVGGFNIPFMGEDIAWSHQIINAGFKTGLVENAYVYHERKDSFSDFYKQIFFFGRSRINISQLIPGSFKILHTLPILYCSYLLSILLCGVFSKTLAAFVWIPLTAYFFLVWGVATFTTRKLQVGVYSVLCVNILMVGYCVGMIKEFYKLYVLKKEQTYIR